MSIRKSIRGFAATLTACIVLCSGLLFFGGCAGETRGTGVRSVSGVVADPLGNPQSNVAVSVSDMPDISTLTDAEGRFDLGLPVGSEPEVLTLAIQPSGLGVVEGTTVIPAGESAVSLLVTLNIPAQSVLIEIVAVATPTAVAQPTSTALPDATPTSVSSPEPTATSAVAPTSTGVPVTAPQVTATPTTALPVPGNPGILTPTPTSTPTRTPCASVVC